MRAITVGNNLVAGTPTVIYTVPKGYYAKWNLLYLLNGTGSTQDISVAWFDYSQNETIAILSNYGLSSKTFFKLDGGAYMVMEEGDYVTITPAAGTFSSIATFEQIKKEGI